VVSPGACDPAAATVTTTAVATGAAARAGLGGADVLAARFLARTFDVMGNAGGTFILPAASVSGGQAPAGGRGSAVIFANFSTLPATAAAAVVVTPAATDEPLMGGAAGGFYVTVTTTVPGTYPLTVFASGGAAAPVPVSVVAVISVVVAPGPPVLADCVLSGDGVGDGIGDGVGGSGGGMGAAVGGHLQTPAVAGRLAALNLLGRDRFGNSAPISEADIEGISFAIHVTVVVPAVGGGTRRVDGAAAAALTPFAPVGIEAPGSSSSAYTWRWTPKVAGKLLISVSLLETGTGSRTPLRRGTQEGTVLAGEVDPAAGTVKGDGMSGSESGASSRMFLIPRDQFGNINATAGSCGHHRASLVRASLPDKVRPRAQSVTFMSEPWVLYPEPKTQNLKP